MRRAVFTIAGSLAIALLGARAHADDAPASSTSTLATPSADPLADEVAATRAEIASTLAQMRETSRHARDRLRMTRKRGTARQITCADEALSRSDVALRRAKEAGDGALAAYARRDVDHARALRRHVAESREVQRIAAKDGAACLPAPIVARSGTSVKLVIDSNIPRVQ